jgi:hypothetical protein
MLDLNKLNAKEKQKVMTRSSPTRGILNTFLTEDKSNTRFFAAAGFL